MEPRFVLASASERRRSLLEQAGCRFEVRPSDVDERALPGERADRYAARVAADKARALPSGLPVLAADTVVALGGDIIDKPADADAARRALGLLSGARHEVHTAVHYRSGERERALLVTTEVWFRRLRPSDIDAYLATGDWSDKAGAYGIQGAGGALVARLSGSYTNVVGLPLEETLALLEAEGLG